MTMEDVYENHLFYNKKPNCKPQQIPCGVLVGCAGSGKTTVFNCITNKQMYTSDGRKTATNSVYISPSGFGQNFNIIDTPGTRGVDDRLSNAINLRMGLIERPLSRIFLCIKHERVGRMLYNLAEELFILQEWKNLITVIVTHWDREVSPENKQEYEYIKNKFMQKHEIIDSFIFIGINANPKSACNAIYQSMCIQMPTQLEISDQYFLCRFDLYECLGKAVNLYIKRFRDLQSSIIQEIQKYDQEDRDEFMHALIIMISQMAEQMIDEFVQKHCESMREFDNYQHYMVLKQSIAPMVEEVRKKASERMSFSLFDQREPTNMFKACPHCRIIWVKEDGCEGESICGNRVSGDDLFDCKPRDTFSTPKFKFSWNNNTFKWVKELVDCSQPKILSNTANSKSDSIGKGCGKVFIWKDQPPIDNKILNELKDVGITDFLVNQPPNKEFKEYIKEAQKRVEIHYLN